MQRRAAGGGGGGARGGVGAKGVPARTEAPGPQLPLLLSSRETHLHGDAGRGAVQVGIGDEVLGGLNDLLQQLALGESCFKHCGRGECVGKERKERLLERECGKWPAKEKVRGRGGRRRGEERGEVSACDRRRAKSAARAAPEDAGRQWEGRVCGSERLAPSHTLTDSVQATRRAVRGAGRRFRVHRWDDGLAQPAVTRAGAGARRPGWQVGTRAWSCATLARVVL